jgi:glycosyltransferase involved in cell wall biosynthesis
MRIVFIADGRSPISRSWISYFIEHGHEVHVIATYPCLPSLLTGASVIQVPMAFSKFARTGPDGHINYSPARTLPSVLIKFLRNRSAMNHLITAWTWLSPLEIHRHIKKIRRLILDISPDLVHAMRIPFEGIVGAIATPATVPLLTSVWGNDFTWIAEQNPFIARQTRRTLQRTDALHSDCFRDQRLAVQDWGFQAKKLSAVLPSSGGIRASIFHAGEPDAALRSQLGIADDAPVVINPRGFRGYVHNETFFQAIPFVLRQRPNMVFLCSAMENNAFAERLVRRIGIHNAVRLLPLVPHEAMAGYFRLAQVSVSPSVHDGTPNSLIEAMACGCFPVAGDIESIREWINPGINGLLCDPADPESIAQAILQALDDDEMRGRAREENLQLIAERAEYGAIMSKAEQFYEQLIGHASLTKRQV